MKRTETVELSYPFSEYWFTFSFSQPISDLIRLQEAAPNQENMSNADWFALAEALQPFILDWNFDNDGSPLEITALNIYELPSLIFVEILQNVAGKHTPRRQIEKRNS